MSPGPQLRVLRERLGWTLREVEAASAMLAAKYDNPEFLLAPSRISDIETKGVVPSIFRLYSLAVIYRTDLREMAAWYGVEFGRCSEDMAMFQPAKTHRSQLVVSWGDVKVPTRIDPSFDETKTCNFSRMVERWGAVPLSYLEMLSNKEYTYAYIGSKDFTMYPLVLPGSFLQIDERKNHVEAGMWSAEYQRPIYFVEMRDEFTCCWCSVQAGKITLQPHPLSPVAVRILRHPQEAEVIGQVVGVAMRLDEWAGSPSLIMPSRRSLLI